MNRINSKIDFDFNMCMDEIDKYATHKRFKYTSWSIYNDVEYDEELKQYVDRRGNEIAKDKVKDVFSQYHNLKTDTLVCSWYEYDRDSDNDELVKHCTKIKGKTWRHIWKACERLGKIKKGLIYIENLFINDDGQLEMEYGI